MKKNSAIIFLVPAFFENRPQSIRFRNLVKHFNPQNGEFLIVLFPGIKNSIYSYNDDKNIIIQEYKGSRLGLYLNQYYYPQNEIKYNYFLKRLRKYFRVISRRIYFPDKFILEVNRLKKEIKCISNNYNIKSFVISSAPFSLLKLSKYVTNEISLSKTQIIFDIGDPLYNNSVKKGNYFKNFRAKFFEIQGLKNIDKLIVTNIETRNHYLRTFPKLISEKNVTIVPMGGFLNTNKDFELKLKPKKNVKLVYAGIFYKKLRSPFKLFESISNFNEKNNQKITLDIYGTGMGYYQSKLPEKAKEFIHFKGVLNNEEIAKKYSNYDAIVHIDNAYGLQTPGKNFELLLSNMPILFIYTNIKSSTFNDFYNYPGVFSSKNTSKDIFNTFEAIKLGGEFIRDVNLLKEFSWEKRSELFFKTILN